MISSQVKDCNRQPIAYVRELKHEAATQTWGRAYEYQILALNKSVTARTQVTPAACCLRSIVSDDPLQAAPPALASAYHIGSSPTAFADRLGSGWTCRCASCRSKTMSCSHLSTGPRRDTRESGALRHAQALAPVRTSMRGVGLVRLPCMIGRGLTVHIHAAQVIKPGSLGSDVRALILIAGQSYFRGGDLNFLPVFLIVFSLFCTVGTICGVACYICKQDKTVVYSSVGGSSI